MTQTRKIDYDASTPQLITNEYGAVIGKLMPRVSRRVLAASAGIQAHSKPGTASSVTPYAGAANVLHFARHWEKHTGRTYPFSTR